MGIKSRTTQRAEVRLGYDGHVSHLFWRKEPRNGSKQEMGRNEMVTIEKEEKEDKKTARGRIRDDFPRLCAAAKPALHSSLLCFVPDDGDTGALNLCVRIAC